jgi:putative transposase
MLGMPKVAPRLTSQTCPKCGAIRKKELSERWHSCGCGYECHRDVAAAQVILAHGLASLGIQSLDATRYMPM